MQQRSTKEDHAIVLDFLPNGYPFDTRPAYMKSSIAQALGKSHLVLLELVPRKGTPLQPSEEVYIGSGKREKIHHVIGRIPFSKLTHTAQKEVEHLVKEMVREKPERFIKFFNKAGPINTRRHQIELLPGIGKKHMWEIIERRKEEPFKDLEDIKSRVKLLPNPEAIIVKRILMELKGEDRYYLFVGSSLLDED